MALQIKPTFGIETDRTVVLEQQTIAQVCESVIAAMVNGLPEEAHTIEAYSYVLDETKKMLSSKRLKLE